MIRRSFPGPEPPFSRLDLLLLTLVSLILLMPTAASAQVSFSEVTVIYGGSWSIQPPPGYTKIPVDLNQGAGGDYIFLCYKKGVGAPITGLHITFESHTPPADRQWTRINVDLNRNAGGSYIWLWYTKDPDCSTVDDAVIVTSTGACPSGYTLIPWDLNHGAGGAYLYLCYRKI
jgi:hypothetical protein